MNYCFRYRPVAIAAVVLVAACLLGIDSVLVAGGHAWQEIALAGVLPAAATGEKKAPGPIRRFLRSALRVTAGVYVGLAGFMFLRQSRMVYFPTHELVGSPRDVGLDYEELQLRTADGGEIHAWFTPAPAGRERGVILLCHGNGGNISHRVDSIGIFHRLGFASLVFDYRGYGKSPGRPSEARTYADADAAWAFLTGTKEYDPSQIVVFGRSLGGAVAARLAARVKPGVLVLESTFTSVPDVGHAVYPWLPVRLLCRYRYPTRRFLSDVTCPVIVVHSPGDEIIPYRFGRALFEAASEPKRFIELQGGHNEGFLSSGTHYTQSLDSALADFLSKQAPVSTDAPLPSPAP